LEGWQGSMKPEGCRIGRTSLHRPGVNHGARARLRCAPEERITPSVAARTGVCSKVTNLEGWRSVEEAPGGTLTAGFSAGKRIREKLVVLLALAQTAYKQKGTGNFGNKWYGRRQASEGNGSKQDASPISALSRVSPKFTSVLRQTIAWHP